MSIARKILPHEVEVVGGVIRPRRRGALHLVVPGSPIVECGMCGARVCAVRTEKKEIVVVDAPGKASTIEELWEQYASEHVCN